VRFITDWLDAWAAIQPDKKLFGFVGPDGSERDGYSYLRFAGVTRQLAGWLRDQDLAWGERVVLAYPRGSSPFHPPSRPPLKGKPAARRSPGSLQSRPIAARAWSLPIGRGPALLQEVQGRAGWEQPGLKQPAVPRPERRMTCALSTAERSLLSTPLLLSCFFSIPRARRGARVA